MESSKLLFLDDWRVPVDCAKYMYHRRVDCRIYHKEWAIVRSYGQFVDYIKKNGLPDVISFDHDIADVAQLKESLDISEWFNADENREYTGMDCAKYLTKYCMDNNLKLPICYVHSVNPDGTENIKSEINTFNKIFG